MIARSFLIPALVFGLTLQGCGHDHDHGHSHDHGDHDHSHEGDHDHAHEGEDGGHGHHHEAPRGGALVVLGEEFAHLELILDGETGGLNLWVLDAHAAEAVRIEASELELTVTLEGGEAETVTLAAQESTLTGEKVGDSSEFRGTWEALVGVEAFQASLKSISIKGSTFEAVSFSYPEGNH